MKPVPPAAAPARSRPPGLAVRVGLLVVCLLSGVAVGIAGEHVTGHGEWYLAIPVFVAIAWFAIADPSRCATGRSDHQSDDPAA